ncbi:hypothetical protein PMZ80_001200 [Knufia obscura]|uniref:Uncharacterized protein n=2 Tax=Knufia TaxID=430999 RepID=A0AAN8F820_9EURO|nr:hypothetical protein PMZ80_001200 [Knufia obscura]KAK5958738.1 hypothetical protein OHC33_000581 [Knufia fluminis]
MASSGFDTAIQSNSSRELEWKITGRAYRFSQPCQSQSASRLLQLPPELRIKILRMLLRSSAPLAPLLEEKQKPDERHSFDLSGQVLATCQVLHKDASMILYKENILTIKVVPADQDWGLECYVVDARMDLVHEPHDLPLTEYDLLSIARSSNPKTHFEECYEGLSQISNVRVILQPAYATRDIAFITCMVLQDLLRGKNVTFMTKISKHAKHDKSEDGTWLLPCRMLRCQHIIFEGHEESCEALVQEVTSSDEPPKDLFLLWTRTIQCVGKLPKVNGQSFDHGDRAMYKFFPRLRSAVFVRDAPTAHNCVTEILKEAIIWNRRYAKQEKAEAKTRYVHRLEMIEALKQCSADVLVETNTTGD